MMINAVIINDPKRKDRLDMTMGVLRRVPNLNIRRSPAVYVNKSRVKLGKTVTAAECGCAMAHRRVWQNYYNSGDTDPILIFEDDIMFSAKTDVVENHLRLEFEEIKAGRKHIAHLGWFSIPKVGTYLGAYAYMLNRKGAAILLREFSTDCPELSFDILLDRLIKSKKIIGGNTLGLDNPKTFHKGVFRPDVNGSTIGYWSRGINSVALHIRDALGIRPSHS